MPKVMTAVTVSESAVLVRGQMDFLSENEFQPVLCSSDGPEMRELAAREDFRFVPVEMSRTPCPLSDLISLGRVLRIIYSEQPEIVNAGTPKAGFLFMLAAFLLRRPIRIYHVRGFRHESMAGIAKKLQLGIEKLCGRLATHVICLTPSVRDLGIQLELFPRDKCHVLGPGSSGIELDRYDPARFSAEDNSVLRASLKIPDEALVLGYVGRLVPRKGLAQLAEAWMTLRNDYPNLYLVLVGPEEKGQPLPAKVSKVLKSDSRVISVGAVDDPAPYFSIMDIFTLPAHWEGFGNVLVEAAAMGKPVVSTTGTGTRDAVKDGYNGLLVPIKDSAALEHAVKRYIDSPALRDEHGRNGQHWAQQFSRRAILEHLRDFYLQVLGRSS